MNNSEFSGEPQVFPLIQALFVDNDWTCLESLLDENIQWHATEPRRDYSGLSQVRDHIESQMHRHRETLICTTAPVSSALNDRYRLITVKALMQGQRLPFPDPDADPGSGEGKILFCSDLSGANRF